MSTPYLGEIRLFAGNFAPVGWALCQGQLLAISENDALFTLLGTTYGGDGQSTFALPNLSSRIPVHQGSGYVLGQAAGSETVTLVSAHLPSHGHQVNAVAGQGGTASPSNAVWAAGSIAAYSDTSPTATMNPAAIAPSGGNQPHDDMLPYLVINFIIALEGIYPSQN